MFNNNFLKKGWKKGKLGPTTYRTPATAYSPSLLKIMLFECNSLTEIFLTPVGSFKSTRLPSVRLLSTKNADTFQIQKPSAVVPKRWVSSSLKCSCKRDSPPSNAFFFIHFVATESSSHIFFCSDCMFILLALLHWSSRTPAVQRFKILFTYLS